MKETKITKQNGNIAFSEIEHKYWDVTDPNKHFISVTTLIDKFVQPFDKDFWSAYKAIEQITTSTIWKSIKPTLLKTKQFDDSLLEQYHISKYEFNKAKQEVLDQWKKKNDESKILGTKTHALFENTMYKKKKGISLKKFEIGGTFECRKDYTDLDLEEAIYPEYLIHYISPDNMFCLAGQIDLLVKKGNHIVIGDYKTCEKIEQKSYYNKETRSSVKMKFPVNNLDDVNYWHYALQLSSYAWMIQQLKPEFEIDDLVLIHIDHSNNLTVYHIPYLKTEVERMFNQYKKDTALETNRAKRVKIVY